MAMKKISAFRRSSVFTVEGFHNSTGTGWETDVNPRAKRKTEDLPNPKDGFLKKRLRANTLYASPVNRPKSKEKIRSRLLLKNGQYNILGKNIPHRRLRFFTDFWNTLIDLNYGIVLLLFVVSLISSWLLFAVAFYVIALVNGDLEEDAVMTDACFVNFENFASAFLYSIETMHTIGYGYRFINDQCAVAIVFMCASALVGCTLEAFIVGVVFAKFQMPAQRAQTLMFSTNAVIGTRDGKLCLLFRIGNMRKSLIIQLAVRAHLVHHRLTEEGELMPFHQHEIHCKLDSMSGNAFSLWPVTACHVITPDSPIYDLNKSSLGRSKFEIIVTLEGVVENTGSVLQARTSYIPQEIVWGHSFTRLLTFRKEKGEYVVDFNHFQTLEPVHGMLGYSARELDENNSMSAPEIIFSSKESQHHPRASTSPGLVKSLSAFHLPTLNREHEGDHVSRSSGSSTRHNSHVDLNLISEIAEILKPPSPSLAHAVSSHTFDSMQAMVREYEHNMRRLSRVSLDMGSHHQHAHHAAPSRRDSSSHHDQLHRSGSPLSMRRIGVNSFAIPPIEEDEQEVQITKF